MKESTHAYFISAAPLLSFLENKFMDVYSESSQPRADAFVSKKCGLHERTIRKMRTRTYTNTITLHKVMSSLDSIKIVSSLYSEDVYKHMLAQAAKQANKPKSVSKPKQYATRFTPSKYVVYEDETVDEAASRYTYLTGRYVSVDDILSVVKERYVV